jgi:release factor glutamine methyltransferase
MQPTIAQALATSRLDIVDARALLRHACGVDDAYLIAHAHDELSAAHSAAFAGMVARRAAGEPVAYITGTREFFSLDFKVTPDVLIPRPETELLVDIALERMLADRACSVLDLGTGSGCVAIAIAKHRPRARVVAVDRSAAALDVACANARRLLRACSISTPTLAAPSPKIRALPHRGGGNRNGCTETPSPLMGEGGDGGDLSLLQSDWFAALGDQRFDVIVANPPYIAAGDAHLNEGDLRFEPATALLAGGDGLDCIRAIVAAAPRYLNRNGWLAFEHGYDQAARCRDLLNAAGYAEVFSCVDIAGIERVSGGLRPES